MLLSVLLQKVNVPYVGDDMEIEKICDHSENCVKGSVFVCHNGNRENVCRAIENGAVLIVANQKLTEKTVVVENTRQIYSLLCGAFFSFAHKKLKLIAVTGTNGKTTTASMIYRILTLSGKKCALTSTVENVGTLKKQDSFTTPDCFLLHSMFYEMAENGTEYCIIEASSQGIKQQRLFGLHFVSVALCNVSQDHLDYHKTMEDYVNAKKSIFLHGDKAILNMDDDYYGEFRDFCSCKTVTYSKYKNEADFISKSIRINDDTIDYAVMNEFNIHRIKLSLYGEFNIMNSLCAIAVCVSEGVSLFGCAAALRTFSGVKGRMEVLPLMKDFTVIIDYAHTPDSLKKVLLSLSSLKKGRVITVFGCGGNRDKEKRPLMGAYASSLSDVLIVTSDNPRNEKPMDIIDDIILGIGKSKTPLFIFENRTKAIEYALKNARKNDIILLAGKGHETTQIIGEKTIEYDEREIVSSLCQQMN